jgi:hypothetical protein
MKLISIISLVIFGCIANTQTVLQNKIKAHLEMSTINNQRHGKLISVNVCVKNDLNKNYFFDGLKPLSLRVLREMEPLNYIDVTQDWMYEEMFFLERDSLYEIFPEDHSTDMIFDPSKKEFANPYAANFYSTQLIKYRSKIGTSNDKEIIKKWVRHKFEGIVYLGKGEMFCKAFSINTLKPGRYKIFFTYSDKDLVSLDDSRGFIKSLDLQLPVEIRGYEKWHGEIGSDTLYYNIK